MTAPASTVSATWSRGLSFRERRGAAAPPVDTQLAERRFARWRAQAPFVDTDLFATRLTSDKLTEGELQALLGEPSTDLAGRIASSPAWLAELIDALSEPGPCPPAAAEELALLAAVEPLLERARQRLRVAAGALLETSAWTPFAPESVVGLLDDVLPGRLFPMLARTMALELHNASRQGALDGETHADRFWSFVEYLADGGGLDLFEAYPVLGRQVATCVEHWTTASLEFLTRLLSDWPLLCRTFGGGSDPGRLVGVKGNLSDPHNGERRVLVLTFESGLRLVYKPKALGVDVHFQELLDWLNARGQQPPLRRLVVVDRQAYGWVEFVESTPCTSPDEIVRFYERQGSLLAILHLLAATDFHYENVIAAGEHPLLIDLEALFHPSLRTPVPSSSFERALARMDNSVLAVGLLPQAMRLAAGSAGIDVSALGATSGQLSPRGVPRWVGGASDEGHVEYARVPLHAGQHRPLLNDQAVDVLDYVEQLVDGFRATYQLLVERQAELLAADGPLAAFAQDTVRVLLRPTVVYALLLGESFHPELLRDGLDRDRFLDRLWVAVPYQPRLVAAIAAEQTDLWAGDIPKFTTRPASTTVWGTTDDAIEGVIEDCGWNVVRRRVEAVGPTDLEQQLWFLRAALGSLPDAPQAPATLSSSAPRAATTDELLAAARGIGDRLDELAIRGQDDATWIGLSSAAGGLSVVPLGADVYEGLPGVALFLAYLGHTTADERPTALARAAVRRLRRQVVDGLTPLSTIGAFSGQGGLLFTLAHLSCLWQDRSLLDEVDAIVAALPPLIAADNQLDIAGGAAGCIGALLAAHAASPSARTVAAAAACGQRLLDTAQSMAHGIGWVTAASGGAALTGFAHGAAGIAWALRRLSTVTDDAGFAAAADAALAYERSQYSPTERNWPDLRWSGAPRFMVAWCHGAAGIGLARLGSLDQSNDATSRMEIQRALETTLRHGALNHSLCHGELGNLDVLLSAAERLNDATWREEARRRAAGALLTAKRSGGWRCATPFNLESPGLMTGLAGIGYGLLRLALPDQVPSLLALEPPRCRIGEFGP